MSDAAAVAELYRRLLQQWNDRDARRYAALFSEGARVIGFDGSEHVGREGIRADLSRIFEDHPTAAYVGKVRDVRLIRSDVALLHAVAGMVPPGGSDIAPAANAVQTLVASRAGDRWQIESFHNTPAAYHGRAEVSERLTEELRELWRSLRPADPA